MHVFRSLLFSLLVVFSGCYSGMEYVVHGSTTETETETIIKYIVTEPEADIWIDSFTQVEAYEAIDIVWVIDGSCSMVAHQTRLLAGIEHMMNNLPPDVNWRLKMITAGDGSRISQPTTFPLTRGDDIDDALQMYNQLPNDGQEKGFDAIKNYITKDSYAQTWMREDAALLVVFVSDEREQSTMTTADFITWYNWTRPSIYLSFIGNVETEDSVCAYSTNFSTIGRKYMDAVNHYSGSIIDICESDWSAGVDDATQNIEPIEEWELTHVPYVDTVVVFEDNAPMNAAHWSYNAVDNMVEFTVTPPENSLIEIGYAIKYYNLPPS